MLSINHLRPEVERYFQRSGDPAEDVATIARQAGTLPYRLTERGYEVLLVTSRGSGRWVLPKGQRSPGETLVQSAARETYEEAGVTGVIEPVELGRFVTTRIRMGRASDHIVVIYPLRVDLELADWPERQLRRRQWWSLSEASSILAYHQRGVLRAMERSLQVTPWTARYESSTRARADLR